MATTQEQVVEERKRLARMVANPTLCWLCLNEDALEPTLGLCADCKSKLKENK